MDARTNKLVFAGLFVLWAVIVLRALFGVKGTDGFEITVSQDRMDSFGRRELAQMQPRSIAENVEYCSIMYEDSNGELGATTARPGDNESCDIRYFDLPGMAPVATIHTHAGFDDDYDSEVPSIDDYVGDIEQGVDGYISTPGGRIWRIDHDSGLIEQLCGLECIESDPGYSRCTGTTPEKRYTFEQLQSRFAGPASSC